MNMFWGYVRLWSHCVACWLMLTVILREKLLKIRTNQLDLFNWMRLGTTTHHGMIRPRIFSARTTSTVYLAVHSGPILCLRIFFFKETCAPATEFTQSLHMYLQYMYQARWRRLKTHHAWLWRQGLTLAFSQDNILSLYATWCGVMGAGIVSQVDLTPCTSHTPAMPVLLAQCMYTADRK